MAGSKYRNIRINGSASRKEAKRKLYLEKLERDGIITDLKCQVPFELIPMQRKPDVVGPRGGVKKGKVIERAAYYYADFTYYNESGEYVVEDTKGYRGGEAYAYYVLKRKLMLWRYGIQVREI